MFAPKQERFCEAIFYGPYDPCGKGASGSERARRGMQRWLEMGRPVVSKVNEACEALANNTGVVLEFGQRHEFVHYFNKSSLLRMLFVHASLLRPQFFSLSLPPLRNFQVLPAVLQRSVFRSIRSRRKRSGKRL